ncbi:4-(cytidine 5'-diphospho)-2-C-methyl-D-erythritol kinase [soil metagenome]
MSRVLLRALAKVNYALEVRGTRSDGYHEVSTVMQSVSLADEVEIETTARGFEIVTEPEDAEIGPLEENTVYKAVRLLGKMAGIGLSARVRLRKRIPAGAGLGGGSADAAATLVGLNELFGLGLSDEELRKVGLKIGADVPFCLSGGTALGEGIGEVLSPLPAPPPHYLVIAKPAAGAETARIYQAYDERLRRGNFSASLAVEALRIGELGALARALGNDLIPTTKSLVPEVRELEEELLRGGALGATMSGTGTSVYGIYGSEAEARAVAEGLRTHFVGVYEPVTRGVELL